MAIGRAVVQGSCDRRYDIVREEFERNFGERGETGASLCVTVGGEVVVDLVGGIADPRMNRPWTPETIVMVWSCTKGAIAICVHALVAMGLLRLEDDVTRYWPEFAAGGKRGTSVAMLLNHQAGIPGIRRPFPAEEVYDFDAMTERLAAEPPQWRPGSRHGYHSFTFGWLNGEIIRRVTGLLPGEFFRDQFAGPLELDFWIGLPADEHHRVAAVELGDSPTAGESPFSKALLRGEPIQASVMNSWGDFDRADVCQDPRVLQSTVPAANGTTNGRGLALLYMPLATGEAIGGLSFSRRAIAKMSSVESAGSEDAVTLLPSRFSSGFEKASGRDGGDVFAITESAFGHTGYGGSVGFADPGCAMSFGYAMNRHGDSEESDRYQRLIDAVYGSLGMRDLI